MRQDNRANTRDFKTEARYRYNERQIEKFIKNDLGEYTTNYKKSILRVTEYIEHNKINKKKFLL